jgi:hypothetical protein
MPDPATLGLFALAALASSATAFNVVSTPARLAIFFLAFLPQFVDPDAGAAWSQMAGGRQSR